MDFVQQQIKLYELKDKLTKQNMDNTCSCNSQLIPKFTDDDTIADRFIYIDSFPIAIYRFKALDCKSTPLLKPSIVGIGFTFVVV